MGFTVCPTLKTRLPRRSWFPRHCCWRSSLALAWGIRRLEDARLALFACCWIALPIIPVLWLRTFSEGDIAHDRYLYYSFRRLCPAGVVGPGEDRQSLARQPQDPATREPRCTRAGVRMGTMTQQTYWASDLMLYGRAYRIAPHDNLIMHQPGHGASWTRATPTTPSLFIPKFWRASRDTGLQIIIWVIPITKPGIPGKLRFFCGEPSRSTPRIPMSTFIWG